jgi:hypothetical protein
MTMSDNVDDDSDSDYNDVNDNDGGDGNNNDGEVECDGGDGYHRTTSSLIHWRVGDLFLLIVTSSPHQRLILTSPSSFLGGSRHLSHVEPYAGTCGAYQFLRYTLPIRK